MWMKCGVSQPAELRLKLNTTLGEIMRRATTKFLRVMLASLLSVILIASSATAQAERATVRFDGRALFRVSAVENADATARAQQIERRLNRLLENPQAIASPQIETPSDPAQRVITVAGVPLVTVTEADAQDNLTGVDTLAVQWAQSLRSALERAGQRRLSPGNRFVTEVQASVETAFGRLAESAITIVPRGLAALLVIGLFWLIASLMRWLMRAIFHHVVSDLTVENLIKQVTYYTVWTLGIIVALDAFGFDPQTVATGLGLTSLAIGFALKDILSNFVSGILILVLRPFELGDQIVVGETEGNVERIELRATQLRTYDGRVVLVPNAEIFTARITNNTASPVRRGSATVFLGYDSNLSQAIGVIRASAQATAGVLAEPSVTVRVQDLGQDDILVEARFWTDSHRSDFVATASYVRQSIVAGLKQASIDLPDPDLRVLIHQPDQRQIALNSRMSKAESTSDSAT